MARAVILPMSPLEFPVFEQIGHASATYSTTVGPIDTLAIKVSCSGPVFRGDSVSCTATAVDPAKTVTVTGWVFEDLHNNAVPRDAAQAASPWVGALVLDGTVTVTGTVDGVQKMASGPARVTPRDWTGKITLKSDTVIATTLSGRPPMIDSLGKTDLSLPLDTASSMARWLKVVGDGGPNDGFSYLLDLPPITTSVSQVNTNAINGTSDFYKIQEPKTKTIGGVKYCAQPVVTGILSGLVTMHEGAVSDPDIYPNSHPAIFRHHVDAVAYARFERAAGPRDPVSPIRDGILNEAVADSKAMDTDSRNYVNSKSLGCDAFHFDYSHLP